MVKKFIRERRCLIPANCYYEWKQMAAGKRPYCIRLEDESPFLIGGMWDVWHAPEEDRLYTFTVLTTFPNEVSGTVHERMPVIVQPKDYQRWLERGRWRHAGDAAVREVDCLPGQPAGQQPEER